MAVDHSEKRSDQIGAGIPIEICTTPPKQSGPALVLKLDASEQQLAFKTVQAKPALAYRDIKTVQDLEPAVKCEPEQARMSVEPQQHLHDRDQESQLTPLSGRRTAADEKRSRRPAHELGSDDLGNAPYISLIVRTRNEHRDPDQGTQPPPLNRTIGNIAVSLALDSERVIADHYRAVLQAEKVEPYCQSGGARTRVKSAKRISATKTLSLPSWRQPRNIVPRSSDSGAGTGRIIPDPPSVIPVSPGLLGPARPLSSRKRWAASVAEASVASETGVKAPVLKKARTKVKDSQSDLVKVVKVALLAHAHDWWVRRFNRTRSRSNRCRPTIPIRLRVQQQHCF